MAKTDPQQLLGTWRMLAWRREVLATGEISEAFGPILVGSLVIRLMAGSWWWS